MITVMCIGAFGALVGIATSEVIDRLVKRAADKAGK